MASVEGPAQPVAPRVFISYSHDSPAHADQVLALADRLRGDGIEAVIDQYETAPPAGWNRWMRNHNKQADFVLAICTETYQRRAEGREKRGTGQGVNREALIIDQQIYDAHNHNAKFIAVLLSRTDHQFIPYFLKPYQNESVETDAQYRRLYRRIMHQPDAPAPPLGTLRAMPPHTRQATPTENVLWTIPPRNPYFSGRDQYLEKLHQALHNGGAAALTQAIQGLGGIGKTQTAIEYAHRHRNEYRAGFFIIADSPSALQSGFAALAEPLGLPIQQEIDKTARAAKEWFETNTNWLLILDNVDNMADVKEWIPQGNGHAILTTRLKATGTLAKAVELLKMTPTEGAQFLLERAKIETPDQKASEADHAAALEISNEVDGLPLALDQAGAYIEEASLSAAEYLEMYRREGKNLRARTYETADHASVHITFTLAFAKLTEPAKNIVRMCAFLAPDAIPEEILTEGKDPDSAFIDARTGATKYSLIERNPANKTIEIHRLVQDVVKDEMATDAQRQQAEQVVNAVNSVFPNGEFKTWPKCERLLPQGREAAQRILQLGIESPAGANLLGNIAHYLSGRGQYAESESFRLGSLGICEKTLGPEHEATLVSKGNLALLYKRQGRLDAAEPLYRSVLASCERVLGAANPSTLTALNNLAAFLQGQRRNDEAEPMHRRALALRELVLGREHHDTLETVNNLAFLLDTKSLLAEAEALYRRALAGRRRIFSDQHPLTLQSQNNLAYLYDRLGRLSGAEPLYASAVAGLEKTLGREHPEAIMPAHNYARFLRELGREGEAYALEARFPRK